MRSAVLNVDCFSTIPFYVQPGLHAVDKLVQHYPCACAASLLLLPGHRSPFINKPNGAGSDVATTDNYCWYIANAAATSSCLTRWSCRVASFCYKFLQIIYLSSIKVNPSWTILLTYPPCFDFVYEPARHDGKGDSSPTITFPVMTCGKYNAEIAYCNRTFIYRRCVISNATEI